MPDMRWIRPSCTGCWAFWKRDAPNMIDMQPQVGSQFPKFEIVQGFMVHMCYSGSSLNLIEFICQQVCPTSNLQPLSRQQVRTQLLRWYNNDSYIRSSPFANVTRGFTFPNIPIWICCILPLHLYQTLSELEDACCSKSPDWTVSLQSAWLWHCSAANSGQVVKLIPRPFYCHLEFRQFNVIEIK